MNINQSVKNNKGFTLIELMVSIGIFALMTGLLLAKYGNFNQGIILTNSAYDIALTIRNAQFYGINVQSVQNGSGSETFDQAYGVKFTAGDSFIFYADTNVNNMYDSNDVIISTKTIKRGNKITNSEPIDISFKRPNPNAIISVNGSTRDYVEIFIESPDGGKRAVTVRDTGQISVINLK